MPSSTPTPPSIEQHTPLSTALQNDTSNYDCLSCRFMGSGAFIGLGAYTYVSGQRQLHLQREVIRKSGSAFGFGARKVGIAGLAAGLVGVGVWRLVI